jgi:oligoribonuclease NrnB/cAMP/cGMP phosphodiesterase (DHH superfamily)
MNRSGAGLTWDYYFSDTGRPPLVSYVEDRDLWRHKLPDSEVINAYIATLPFTFEAWEQASQLMLSDQEAGVSLSQAKQWGQMAQQKTLQYVREVTKNTRSVNFEGLAVPCVNAPQVDISELLDGVCKQFPDAPFVVGWWQRGDGIFQYSLRSRGDFDVSEVAKKHGGGGHKSAAGFQKDHLIFGS